MRRIELNERIDLTKYENQASRIIYSGLTDFFTPERRAGLLNKDTKVKTDLYGLITELQDKLGDIADDFAARNDIPFLNVITKFYSKLPSTLASMSSEASIVGSNTFLKYYITVNLNYMNDDFVKEANRSASSFVHELIHVYQYNKKNKEVKLDRLGKLETFWKNRDVKKYVKKLKSKYPEEVKLAFSDDEINAYAVQKANLFGRSSSANYAMEQIVNEFRNGSDKFANRLLVSDLQKDEKTKILNRYWKTIYQTLQQIFKSPDK